ncbi:hypothetical protein MCEMSEM23_02231 [Rhabdaerophilaceae bacterium]
MGLAHLAGLFLFAIMANGPALAAKGSVTASELPGHARLIFAFDGLVGAKLRTNGAVLIIEFDQSVTVDPDKLPMMVPNYIGVARLDPDGRSIRIGLNNRFRSDLKPAGEKLFLDLLGPRWQGMAPPLPQDVVDELVARARAAEERIKRTQVDRKPMRDLELRVAHAPRFRRAIFTMPSSAAVDMSDEDGKVVLTFGAAFNIADTLVRAQLAGLIESVSVESGPSSLRIAMRPADGYKIRGFREDDSYTLDFTRADGKSMADQSGAPRLSAPPKAPTSEVGAQSAAAPVPANVEAARPAGDAGSALNPIKAETIAGPVKGKLVDFRLEPGQDPDSFSLRLSSVGTAPVAVVQRGVTLMVLVETQDGPGAPSIPPELKAHIDGFQLTRLKDGVLLNMSPKREGAFWLIREGDDLVLQRGRSLNADKGFAGQPIRLSRVFDAQGRDAIEAVVEPVGKLFMVDDPATGGRFYIVPQVMGGFQTPKQQSFAEFSVERTLAGLAVLPLDEAVIVSRRDTGVLISHDIKLNLSAMPARDPASNKDRRALLLDVENIEKLAKEPLLALERRLLKAAADAPRVNRSAARLRLAHAYIAHRNYAEADGVLKVLTADDPLAGAQKSVIFARALATTFEGRHIEATRLLAEPQLAAEPEQKLLQAIIDAKALRYPQAVAAFRAAEATLDRYPDALQATILPLAITAGIEASDAVFAREKLQKYEVLDPSYRRTQVQQLLGARLAESEGRPAEAFNGYAQAALSTDRAIEAEARFGRATSGMLSQRMTPEDAKSEFETLTAIWRRSEVEVKALARLGEIYAGEGRWREAFLASQRATALMPNHPIVRAMEEAMGQRFESLFLDAKENKLSKVEALAIYQEFRTLVPPGRRGDEIARRLADRLFDLDLVNEAADILEHQVKNRLEGVARAAVATQLAVMHMQNRAPVKALTILAETRLSSIPNDLKRARTLLEARALGEVFRTELAIERLANEQGNDVERLRADIQWKGKQWREAGESYERVLADAWQGEESLTDQNRVDVLRAGLAYVLAEERLALDRLRSRYATKMAKSDDSGTFNLITLDSFTNPNGFREAARSIVNADTLTEFLTSYRARYPETSGESRPARSAGDQRQSAASDRANGRG